MRSHLLVVVCFVFSSFLNQMICIFFFSQRSFGCVHRFSHQTSALEDMTLIGNLSALSRHSYTRSKKIKKKRDIHSDSRLTTARKNKINKTKKGKGKPMSLPSSPPSPPLLLSSSPFTHCAFSFFVVPPHGGIPPVQKRDTAKITPPLVVPRHQRNSSGVWGQMRTQQKGDKK